MLFGISPLQCLYASVPAGRHKGKQTDRQAGELAGGQECLPVRKSENGQAGNYVMQDMWVYTDISEGEDLTLGIRSGNYNPDGTPGTVFKNGWFKVDYFRINKMTTDGITSLSAATDICPAKGIYTLDGRMLTTSTDNMKSLPKGVYIIDGKKKVVR